MYLAKTQCRAIFAEYANTNGGNLLANKCAERSIPLFVLMNNTLDEEMEREQKEVVGKKETDLMCKGTESAGGFVFNFFELFTTKDDNNDMVKAAKEEADDDDDALYDFLTQTASNRPNSLDDTFAAPLRLEGREKAAERRIWRPSFFWRR